jgi:integrase
MYNVLATRNGLSPATVRKVHALLNQSLSAALRYGVLTRNPMTSVKAPRVTTHAIDTLSGTEVRAILDTASARRDDSYPRFLLALRLGLRQGECLALTWADIDFARATVSVTKSVDVLPGRGAIVSPPKSAQSRRVVPMDSETFRAFEALKCRSGEPGGASLLFPSVKGVFRNARVDYDAWRGLLAEAGVRYVKLHAARHTAATLFLESGADARSIQLILGHSSPGFTLATYVHPKSETLRAIIERSSQ